MEQEHRADTERRLAQQRRELEAEYGLQLREVEEHQRALMSEKLAKMQSDVQIKEKLLQEKDADFQKKLDEKLREKTQDHITKVQQANEDIAKLMQINQDLEKEATNHKSEKERAQKELAEANAKIETLKTELAKQVAAAKDNQPTKMIAVPQIRELTEEEKTQPATKRELAEMELRLLAFLEE
ncbi:MAG: hypothetical protein EZS28_055006, partial [Streblomastix strix]